MGFCSSCLSSCRSRRATVRSARDCGCSRGPPPCSCSLRLAALSSTGSANAHLSSAGYSCRRSDSPGSPRSPHPTSPMARLSYRSSSPAPGSPWRCPPPKMRFWARSLPTRSARRPARSICCASSGRCSGSRSLSPCLQGTEVSIHRRHSAPGLSRRSVFPQACRLWPRSSDCGYPAGTMVASGMIGTGLPSRFSIAVLVLLQAPKATCGTTLRSSWISVFTGDVSSRSMCRPWP